MSNDEALLSIIYVSSATRLLADDELGQLLRAAREHNARRGITGLLLYGDGNFMQLLEGPESEVAALYARIQRDPRHHTVITVQKELGLPREFVDWSMAYRRVDAPTWLRLSRGIGADGRPLRLSAAKGVLQDFWATLG